MEVILKWSTSEKKTVSCTKLSNYLRELEKERVFIDTKMQHT